MGDDGGGHWLVRIEWRPARWSLLAPAYLGGLVSDISIFVLKRDVKLQLTN